MDEGLLIPPSSTPHHLTSHTSQHQSAAHVQDVVPERCALVVICKKRPQRRLHEPRMIVHGALVYLTENVPELPESNKGCESKAHGQHCNHDYGINLH